MKRSTNAMIMAVALFWGKVYAAPWSGMTPYWSPRYEWGRSVTYVDFKTLKKTNANNTLSVKVIERSEGYAPPGPYTLNVNCSTNRLQYMVPNEPDRWKWRNAAPWEKVFVNRICKSLITLRADEDSFATARMNAMAAGWKPLNRNKRWIMSANTNNDNRLKKQGIIEYWGCSGIGDNICHFYYAKGNKYLLISVIGGYQPSLTSKVLQQKLVRNAEAMDF